MNKIRDFSSGILKQLANVLKMLRNMSQSRSGLRRLGGLCGLMISQVPPLASIFALAEALNACALTVSFLDNSPSPRILIPLGAAIGQAGRAQRRFIHARAVVKLVQFADVHRE